jgi:gamma-glutamyltranspeptidase / glutathione hydrolase
MLIPDQNSPGKFRAPRMGELFTNPYLAKTFRTVAQEGRESFYEGRIAKEIVKGKFGSVSATSEYLI